MKEGPQGPRVASLVYLRRMQTGIIVLVVAALLLLAWVAWYQRERRRKEWHATAARLGLRYSSGDPFGLSDLPFALFGRGDGRGWENVAWGTWEGLAVKAFEFWFYETSSDGQGHTSRSYSRFSCALCDIDAACPGTTLTPENFFTRLADRLGFDDIGYEWEEFNRAWQVSSADRRFASYLVDAGMMEWLMTAQGWSFEVWDRNILCYCRRVAPSEIDAVLHAAAGFRRKIPRVVHDVYGAAP